MGITLRKRKDEVEWIRVHEAWGLRACVGSLREWSSTAALFKFEFRSLVMGLWLSLLRLQTFQLYHDWLFVNFVAIHSSASQRVMYTLHDAALSRKVDAVGCQRGHDWLRHV